MGFFGAIIFVGGLVLVVAVFANKHAAARGRITVPEVAITRLDDVALASKAFVNDLGLNVRKLPPLAVLVVRYFVHRGAIAFAQFANRLEKQAHAIADRVSHKHKFQRQLPRNSFLHKVAEVKKADIETQVK